MSVDLVDVVPVAAALEAVSGARGMLVLRDLLWDGPTRISVLERHHGEIRSSHLVSLAGVGLVSITDANDPVVQLTVTGASAGPVIELLRDFGSSLVRSVPLSESMLDYLVARAADSPTGAALARQVTGVACLEIAGRRVGISFGSDHVGPVAPDPHDGRLVCAHDIFVDILDGLTKLDDVVDTRLAEIVGDHRVVNAAIHLLQGVPGGLR